MAYFANMPVFDYPFIVNGRTERISSRNIMVRAKFLDYVKNTQTTYLNYIIRDGEKPETLAHRVYGSSDLHWVILLFNEILDPLFGWPVSSYDLESAVNTKYSGVALFIDMKNVQLSAGQATLTKANEELWYEVGSKVTQGTAIGIVESWDPCLYKIVIKQTSVANFVNTPDVTNLTNTTRDLVHVRGDGVTLYSAVGRVVNNKYAVHHFVDVNTGEVMDQHATGDGGLLDSSIIDRYAVLGMEIIPLVGRTVAYVSNYQHEIERNDALRSIKMMRPELMDIVIRDMREVFGG